MSKTITPGTGLSGTEDSTTYTLAISDQQLLDIAGLTPTDNAVIIGNGTNFVAESGATLKTSLGLTIGTDVQAYDADLADLATQWSRANASGAANLHFHEDTDNGTNRVKISAPASIASNVDFVLPNADGTNGQALITDGSGNLSFTTITGGGTPGGSNGHVQYNIGGAFQGDANLTVDGLGNLTSTASVTVGGNSTAAGKVIFKEDSDNGSNSITIEAPASIASDRTLTLPDATGTVALTSDITVTASSSNTFTNKTIDADGTGNVITNIGSSEIKSEIISGLSSVSAATGDTVMIGDASDSNNLKKVTVDSIAALASAGSGDLVKVATLTASSSPDLEFTGMDSATYSAYKFVFNKVYPSAANTSLMAQWGDVGSGYAYNHNYANTRITPAGTQDTDCASNDTQIRLCQTVKNDDTNWAPCGVLEITGFNDTNAAPNMAGWIANYTGSARRVTNVCAMGYNSSVDYTKIKFYFDSGNIASGNILVYGYKR